MPGHQLPLAIATVIDAMTILDVHPLEFEAGPDGASMTTVMPASVLHQRSTGPYRADRPPPEAVSLARLVASRYGSRPHRPELDLDLALDVPRARLRLIMQLAPGTVRITFVVPEEAPPVWQPPPGDRTVPADVKTALLAIGGSVQELGVDGPMSVTLSYLRGRPVVPTFELDRRAMPPELRRRHERLLAAMPGVRPGSRPGAWPGGMLPGGPLEMWAGVARIRDAA